MIQDLVLTLALTLFSAAAPGNSPTTFAANELDCNSDGCVAQGDIVIINNNVVITAQKAKISSNDNEPSLDDLQGVRLRLKKEPLPENLASMGQRAITAGKNQLDLGGNLQQCSDGYQADNVFFTTCDCGPECSPSWWLRAKKAKLVLTGPLSSSGEPTSQDPMGIKNRVHLFNLVPYIKPFDLFTTPIFWLPYISYPLQKRAFGLLAPRITSMFSEWPAIDLPLFIPIGQSYDVTIIPGYFPTRGPRAGLEFRYAPVVGTYGEMSSQYTAHIHSPEKLFASNINNLDPRRHNLIHRWDYRWHHQSDIARQLNIRWDIDVVGDRLYLYDFSPSRRSATYLPSRFQLLWQSKANLSLQISGDFYQDLRPHWATMNEATADSCRDSWREECNVYYNWHDISQMVQRLPAIRLVLSPTSWGKLPLWSSGEINSTIYAPWNNYGSNLFGFLGGRVEIGGSGQKWRIPLAFTTSYNYSLAFDGERGLATYHFPRINIFSDTHLGRLFTYKNSSQRLTHRLNFRADYLLIPIIYQDGSVTTPWASTENSIYLTEAAALTEEHLQLKPVHQILLTAGTSLKIRPLGLNFNFSLSQGWNLGAITGATAAGLGQLGLKAAINLPEWVDAVLRLSWDWHESIMREINASGKFYFGHGWLPGSYISAGYFHLKGGSDQQMATIYEIMPGGGFPATMAGGEDHYLNAAINFKIKNWSVRYGLRYIFALDSLSAVENAARYRGDLDRHYLTIGYKSACDCWGLSVALIMPHQFLKGNNAAQFAPSFNIVLDLAGLAMGLKQ